MMMIVASVFLGLNFFTIESRGMSGSVYYGFPDSFLGVNGGKVTHVGYGRLFGNVFELFCYELLTVWITEWCIEMVYVPRGRKPKAISSPDQSPTPTAEDHPLLSTPF
jgi:hypothetical protein